MALRASYSKKVFQFNFKARTSRGLMKDKTSWFIRLLDDQNENIVGVGECAPLPGLSKDFSPEYEAVLASVLEKISQMKISNAELQVSLSNIVPPDFSSIIFGLETASLDLQNGGSRLIFKNAFQEGNKIPINGLVWMGDMDFMMTQINQKISQGFRCIKLKVGGLDFDRECDILNYIRKRYFRENITIRLDANGAFKIDDVLFRLEELAKFNIHSIEQPIKPGLPEMEELCRKSPIPVAFDEELIGVSLSDAKKNLLNKLKPQFIVLKPMLHGGLKSCEEWIDIAESLQISWWITSSLESNIGLNAICQFTANYESGIHQGLGTGSIYQNNFESPIVVENGAIFYNPALAWNLSELDG
jgi:O-succinylbenzoate synthase